MNRFDLHVHSRFSSDALSSPESLLKKARQTGLKGFAITDHNQTSAFKDFQGLQKKYPEILVVKGEEVKIVQNGKAMGELLCFFFSGQIQPASCEDTLDG